VETGLYWEEFTPGRRWRTADREIKRTDVAAFSALSGDENALHRDDAAARASGFDGVVAHGVLGVAVATGLINRLRLSAGTLVALLGTAWRFEQPIYPGTRVHVDVLVESRRETRQPDRGVVVLAAELATGDDAVLQRGELTLLVRRTPASGRGLDAQQRGG
jgi:3-hydroxybutyryl-CoA dehydratase